MARVKKIRIKLPIFAAVSFLIALASVCFVLLILLPLCRNAKGLGKSIGTETGTLAGAAVGSLRGIAEGSAAYQAGTETGLTAKDTETELRGSLSRVGKLDVLVADVSVRNLLQAGEDVSNYSELIILSGQAVFSVDLTAAEIIPNGSTLQVILPKPEMDFRLDMGKTQTLAVYEKQGVSFSKAQGYEAYINSLNQLSDRSNETLRDHIVNYDMLIEQAQNYAAAQVRRFAEAVSINERQISISFLEGGGMSDGEQRSNDAAIQ